MHCARPLQTNLVRIQFSTPAVAMLSALLLFLWLAPFAQAQTFQVIYNFDGYTEVGGMVGVTPDNAGNLYGGAKTVYRLSHKNSGWIVDVLHRFGGLPDGDGLSGRVIFGPGGSLYGPTVAGGLPNCLQGEGCGTVFNVKPPLTICKSAMCSWNESVLYRFTGPPDGYYLQGDIAFDAAGNLYGTAYHGGQYDYGMVYQLSPSNGGWTENEIYSFTGQSDGAIPFGIVTDSLGNLYGVTALGGSSSCMTGGCGTVYELSPSGSGWTFKTIYTFQNTDDGLSPFGGLIFDAHGNLYGTTQEGGPAGGGTVFELTPSNGGWQFNLLYGLTGQFDTADGPQGSLAMDSEGNLYGETVFEGTYGWGSIFKLSPAAGGYVYTDLHDFTGGDDGGFPYGDVTLDSDGDLFGTTFQGGNGNNCRDGCGVVWEVTQ